MSATLQFAYVTHSSVQGWIITGFDYEIEYADGPVSAPGMVGPFSSCGEAEAVLNEMRCAAEAQNALTDEDREIVDFAVGSLIQQRFEVEGKKLRAIINRLAGGDTRPAPLSVNATREG